LRIWIRKPKYWVIDLASYRAMTYTNDAHTVHTCQTRSVCKPRPPAYIQGQACIQGRPLLAQLRQTPGLYSRPGLYLRPGFYSRKYGILIRKWCHNKKNISQRLPHILVKKTAGTDTVWRNYVNVTLCIASIFSTENLTRQDPWESEKTQIQPDPTHGLTQPMGWPNRWPCLAEHSQWRHRDLTRGRGHKTTWTDWVKDFASHSTQDSCSCDWTTAAAEAEYTIFGDATAQKPLSDFVQLQRELEKNKLLWRSRGQVPQWPI